MLKCHCERCGKQVQLFTYPQNLLHTAGVIGQTDLHGEEKKNHNYIKMAKMVKEMQDMGNEKNSKCT